MTEKESVKNDFLKHISEIIDANISNEQFGVSELAQEIGMSRSNLLRKVKSKTDLSASQFIRKVRLERAMELLKETTSNVSEVSFQVGFNSPSYFIKCFHDHYGFSPGELGKQSEQETSLIIPKEKSTKNNRQVYFLGIIILIIVSIGFGLRKIIPKGQETMKSIAVLPFQNDSNDSTNIYVINGLMESILSNLQKIEDLRVVSRTSVEQYRHNPKSIKEIANELDVQYIVEGSGQKNGKNIFLNIQLIEAETDKHLLSEQYRREDKDIFDLQAEISKNIAGKIEAIITPDEKIRIEKVPTDDLEAYDEFLKGWNLMFSKDRQELFNAIDYFKKAVELDETFALALADMSLTYSFLDIYMAEKQYLDSSNYYADKAMFHDSDLEQSLLAKAMFYMNSYDYQNALPYLEKALEVNPNSVIVINALSDYYASYLPDTQKYLEYALKGLSLDIGSRDSAKSSISFLHLGNAFIQTGFVDEALYYINKSIDYDSTNLYSEYVKAFIIYARDGNLEKTKYSLIQTLNKDTTRLDVLQEVAKICYYMRDFEVAFAYYQPFVEARKNYDLGIFRSEDAKIGMVYSKVGLTDESKELFQDYFEYTEYDKSIYNNLSRSIYYAYHNNIDRSLEQMRLFSEKDNYHYWTILFLKIDPLIDNIKDLPEYKKIIQKIENKFWESHNRIRSSLEDKGLL